MAWRDWFLPRNAARVHITRLFLFFNKLLALENLRAAKDWRNWAKLLE